MRPSIKNPIKNLLIAGGAGYIGSHMVNIAVKAGYNVVVLDNLVSGNQDSVNKKAKLIIGDIADNDLVKKIIVENKIQAVMHFAAFIEAGESVNNPLKYYENNVAKTINFLNSVVESGINYFIFSSTAAIFGEAKYLPIDEDHPKNPVNPYGKSKLMIEEVLYELNKANKNFKYGCLRYFNASGADYENNLGENHDPETHLIPLLIRFANGKKNDFFVNGNDYETYDGTCVRDYIHVLDICDAHLKLLDYLENGGEEKYFNLGSESGYSVLDIVKVTEKIIGKKLDIKYGKRRKGDAVKLVTSSKKAQEILDWKLKHSDLESIVNSVWKWEKLNKKIK